MNITGENEQNRTLTENRLLDDGFRMLGTLFRFKL